VLFPKRFSLSRIHAAQLALLHTMQVERITMPEHSSISTQFRCWQRIGLRCLCLFLFWMPAYSAQTEKVLHAFTGRDGAGPESLVSDAAGNLYGVANIAGDPAASSCTWSVGTGCGTVFELSPTAGGGWTTTILHRFTGAGDGRGPVDLAIDASGNLFGVAQQGGNTTGCVGGHGCGTLFELSPSAAGWRFRRLHAFTGGTDGAIPLALTLDASGTVYVTLSNGGNTDCGSGCGTIFRMQRTSSGWKGSTIRIFDWTFANQAAANPEGRVTFDAAGNLYGVAAGGSFNTVWSATFGVVYRLTPSSAGQWMETDLYDFCPDPQVFCTQGTSPLGGPILDASGNLFGTAVSGGSADSGTVFELTPMSSGPWSVNVLYSFTGGSDGGSPVTRMIFNSAGDLLGTTSAGGDPNCACGVLFQLTPSAGVWHEAVLHRFTGGYDGNNPSSNSGLLLDQSGNIFGTAVFGGLATTNCQGLCGLVYEYGSFPSLH
jgi:uncharacterized repeat protein (TIGR03803 family)